ncbi:MAG: hypothetical protein HFE36_05010 [Clostridia bacterium]|nr:hypothetical protein [Clostridia bacterium]
MELIKQVTLEKFCKLANAEGNGILLRCSYYGYMVFRNYSDIVRWAEKVFRDPKAFLSGIVLFDGVYSYAFNGIPQTEFRVAPVFIFPRDKASDCIRRKNDNCEVDS